jgi:hypothetical protein
VEEVGALEFQPMLDEQVALGVEPVLIDQACQAAVAHTHKEIQVAAP